MTGNLNKAIADANPLGCLRPLPSQIVITTNQFRCVVEPH
jgi:hypothetical protein